jgi:hypothetical protein
MKIRLAFLVAFVVGAAGMRAFRAPGGVVETEERNVKEGIR